MTSVTARAAAFAKLWLFPFVLILGLLAPGLASADGRPFDRIVIFGDSLSDSGNLFVLQAAQGIQPGGPANNWGMDTGPEFVTLIPGQAYVSGRLSNGPTWVELLGTALGLWTNTRPVFANPADPRRFNFAVAGATGANLLPPGVPAGDPLQLFHLGGQVNAFLARALAPNGTGTTSDTLYVIAIGGNDVRAVGSAGPGLLVLTLAAVEKAIRDLHMVGGSKFLIWNIPDLGGTPALQRLENGVPLLGVPPAPGTVETARFLIAGSAPQRNGGYNALLNAKLQSLSAELGVEFIHFDAFRRLAAVQAEPRRYGLANAEDPCIQIMPFFPVAGTCRHPDRHFFWDGIHPTRAGHAIIAFLNGKALIQALHD